MQRLIYSSQIPSKLHSNPHPCVPQLPSRTGSFVPATTPSQFGFGSGSIRFGLSSSRLQRLESNCLANPNGGPSTSSFCFSPLIDQNEEVLPPKARVVEKSEKAGWNPLKAFATAKIILLSVITITLIHPILPNPAFASFPAAAAAKTGGSVGNGLLRTEILTSAWTGFFAGCLHTLSGPDHLAALAPLSIGRTRMESAAVGALWGFGHEAGQVIFGLLFLLLKDRLHIEVIQTWGTRVVGLTLLVIGAMGIKEAMESHPTFVSLKNGEQDLSAYESNVGKKKIGFATFATGIVHGLQPDALMMVLPALALPSRVAGAAFLGMFLIGTVVAMGGYTVFIGSCSQALKDRIPRITEKLTWAASLIAIGLGLAILISQFFGFTLY